MTVWPAGDKVQPPTVSPGDLSIPPTTSRHYVASTL
jgi:hypothetical protein